MPTIYDWENDEVIDITEDEVKKIFPEFKFNKPLPNKVKLKQKIDEALENIPFDLQ